MTADPASFRDPSGHVYRQDDRIYRTVTALGLPEYRAVKESGVLDGLVDRALVIESAEVSGVAIDGVGPDTLVLEHPCLPVISYPYEWPFRA
ncbi:MAG: class I SAM-dependent methyltransferase, partial [Alphaproteobacteria bacterium]|nr:class I SAM-dependent methyltransferase [Alphaproteobacteria bacterium]